MSFQESFGVFIIHLWLLIFAAIFLARKLFTLPGTKEKAVGCGIDLLRHFSSKFGG